MGDDNNMDDNVEKFLSLTTKLLEKQDYWNYEKIIEKITKNYS